MLMNFVIIFENVTTTNDGNLIIITVQRVRGFLIQLIFYCYLHHLADFCP